MWRVKDYPDTKLLCRSGKIFLIYYDKQMKATFRRGLTTQISYIIIKKSGKPLLHDSFNHNIKKSIALLNKKHFLIMVNAGFLPSVSIITGLVIKCLWRYIIFDSWPIYSKLLHSWLLFVLFFISCFLDSISSFRFRKFLFAPWFIIRWVDFWFFLTVIFLFYFL